MVYSSPVCPPKTPVRGLAEGSRKRKREMRTDARSNCPPMFFPTPALMRRSYSQSERGWIMGGTDSEVRRLLSIVIT